MFQDNLITLRKLHHMTQEELAKKLGITRQTISKWESGESVPDLANSQLLAAVFRISLDQLVNFDSFQGDPVLPPEGRYLFGVMTVGERGQIVIPAKARKTYNIQPGDKFIFMGDEMDGLSLIRQEEFGRTTRLIKRR